MGLRVIACLYDRSEALVMSTCLDAAGIPNWLFGAELININPFHEIAYHGYRLVVSDDDLQQALDVIGEARANPLVDGGRLHIRHLTILSLFLFFIFPGVIAPLKLRRWHDASDLRA
jgi:hypothetical protein